jgi:hypothetical protein
MRHSEAVGNLSFFNVMSVYAKDGIHDLIAVGDIVFCVSAAYVMSAAWEAPSEVAYVIALLD